MRVRGSMGQWDGLRPCIRGVLQRVARLPVRVEQLACVLVGLVVLVAVVDLLERVCCFLRWLSVRMLGTGSGHNTTHVSGAEKGARVDRGSGEMKMLGMGELSGWTYLSHSRDHDTGP